jgi:hypothetical protein
VALTRYLISVVICWAVLAFVAMLVGPAPAPEAAAEPADGAAVREAHEAAGGEAAATNGRHAASLS